MLALQLFGSPQVLLDGVPLAVPRRKSRALIYYLAVQQEPVSRDRALNFFWPEHDRQAAQQLLRTTLHGLRKLFGPLLLASDDSLALVPERLVDALQLEAAVGAVQPSSEWLAPALAAYRGEFLEDFALPDTLAFEEWVGARREHYRSLALRGFATLARRYELGREYPAALDALGRALDLDPLQEDLQRAAMRLHYLSGDRASAIRRYEQLRRLLDDEMGVPPMAETRTLYDAIITDSLAPEPAAETIKPHYAGKAGGRLPITPFLQPPALPFYGRDDELAALRAAGSGRLIIVEGEAGIGKTRLVEEFLRSHEGLVLIGAARELEHSLPYQPLIEALRLLLALPDWTALRAALQLPAIWTGEVARLLPELAPAGQNPAVAVSESRLWEGVGQLVLALARQRSLAIFLDDLQWADDSTLALLGFLVRRTAGASLLLLGTARPSDVRSPLQLLLQTLAREDRLSHLRLERLSESATLTLASGLSPDYAAPLAAWLQRNAEGNPYIISELVRDARARGLLRPDGVLNLDLLSAAPVVPQPVFGLISSRLARLSDGARRVLDAGVAVGREFDFDVVARAAALSEPAALDALDELQAAGLIRPGDGLRYVFDHSLTMEVAYREVGEPRHRLLHRRVAEAIEALHRNDLDAVAGLLASHFAEGGIAERAAHYAIRAGKQAANLAAWREALAFYRQALAGLGSDADTREAVLLLLGDAALRVGETSQASEAYHDALALALARSEPGGIDAVRLALGRALLTQGRYAEMIDLARQVRASGDPALAARAELLWGTALSLEGLDLCGAVEHLCAAANLLDQHAGLDPDSQAQISFELGSIAAQQGDLDRALTYYRETLATARSASGSAMDDWQALALNNLAFHGHLQGDPGSRSYAEEGLRLAEQKGLLTAHAYLFSTLGEIALAAGDLAEAARCFEEGLALAERLEMPERIAGISANLGRLASARGQQTLAVHLLSTALARADSLGAQHLAAQIRLWLAPLLPPAQARAYLAEARAIAERGGRARLLAEVRKLQQADSGA